MGIRWFSDVVRAIIIGGRVDVEVEHLVKDSPNDESRWSHGRELSDRYCGRRFQSQI